MRLLDAAGAPVAVSARLELSGAPARLELAATVDEIAGWAGPWPVDERWWDDALARRVVRMQVLLTDGRAMMLALRGGHWELTMTFD